jgi:hypothetical protein
MITANTAESSFPSMSRGPSRGLASEAGTTATGAEVVVIEVVRVELVEVGAAGILARAVVAAAGV